MNATAEKLDDQPEQPIDLRVTEAVTASAELTFDIDNAKGEKAARSHVAALRRLKGDAGRWKDGEKEEMKKQAKLIDGNYNTMVALLDGAIDLHHAPIKAKEDAEKARLAEIDKQVDELKEMCAAEDCLTSDQIRDRKKLLEGMNLDPDALGERGDEARELLEAGLIGLTQRLARALQAEKDAKELEDLRQEKADREAQEKADAKAAADAEKEADAQAVRDAEIEAAKKQAREDAELEAKQKADAEAEEKRKREADVENRLIVHKQITDFLDDVIGLNEADADAIVTALSSGTFPHVTINY